MSRGCVITLEPGYTIEEHAAVISKTTNEDIHLYILDFHNSLNWIVYVGKGIDSGLLDAIRSDGGVDSVECS